MRRGTPIFVIGMHRSGTSCLTGILEEAGLFLGDVKQKSRFNAKGNRENFTILELHEQILRDNQATWDCPPAETCIWSEDHRRIRDEILATYPQDVTWGIKDPRMLFTLEGWQEVLPDVRLIATFRHPLAVAKSLNKRNGFTIERGIDLWCQYNSKLCEYLSTRAIPLINFDLSGPEYLDRIRRLTPQLGLSVPDHGFSFFEESLRTSNHQIESELPQHTEAHRVYQRLSQFDSNEK